MSLRKFLLMQLKNPGVTIGIVFILVLMISLPQAGAFAHLASNNTSSGMGNITTNTTTNITTNITTNTTTATTATTASYGVHIIIMSHLIEIDMISNPGYLKVSETMIFRNIGSENHTGPIYSWLQDDAFNQIVIKMDMGMEGQGTPIETFQVDNNVIGWNDILLTDMSMPSMYSLEYMVPAEPSDKKTGLVTFSKKLKHPTTVNYDYMPMPGMSALVIKLKKPDETTITITDSEKTPIQADLVEDMNNIATYNWIQPQFNGISIEMKESTSDGSVFMLYSGIVLIIIGIVSYFLLKDRSPAIKGFKEKLQSSSIQDEPNEDIYLEMDEEYGDEDEKEESSRHEVLNKKDIENLNPDELSSAKKAIYKVIMELDDDFSKGIISEHEYDAIRKKYKKKAMDIKERIDRVNK